MSPFSCLQFIYTPHRFCIFVRTVVVSMPLVVLVLLVPVDAIAQQEAVAILITGGASGSGAELLDDIGNFVGDAGDSSEWGVEMVVYRPRFELLGSITSSVQRQLVSTDRNDFGADLLTMSRSGAISAGIGFELQEAVPAVLDWDSDPTTWKTHDNVALHWLAEHIGFVGDLSITGFDWRLDGDDAAESATANGNIVGLDFSLDVELADGTFMEEENEYRINVLIGSTSRFLGGDFTNDDSMNVSNFIGTKSRNHSGLLTELGIEVNAVRFFATATLFPGSVGGLSSLQLYAGAKLSSEAMRFIADS